MCSRSTNILGLAGFVSAAGIALIAWSFLSYQVGVGVPNGCMREISGERMGRTLSTRMRYAAGSTRSLAEIRGRGRRR